MSEKLTPQEAYEAAKKLFPNLVKIRRSIVSPAKTIMVMGPDTPPNNYIDAAVNWPEDVDEWPAPPAQWRDAVWPDDWGKHASFADDGDWSQLLNHKLVGYDPDVATGKWISSSGLRWRKCRIKVEESDNCLCQKKVCWRQLRDGETVRSTDEFNGNTLCDLQAYSQASGWITPCATVNEAVRSSIGVYRRRIVYSRDDVVAGDGYRILDPEEKPEKGDEYWNRSFRGWLPTGNYASSNPMQSSGYTYRRKIR